MTQLAMHDDTLIALRNTRPPVVLARITDDARYRALLAYNVKPVVAAGVARGLITVKLTA